VAAGAVPGAAWGQPDGVPLIGFLRSTAASGATHLVAEFWRGMGEAGFVEGRNATAIYRYADGQHDRLPDLAADLVRQRCAAIVGNAVSVRAAMAATTSVPIVFVAGTDPVKTGLVSSINRPGGNVTGVVFDTTLLAAKRLGFLNEIIAKDAPIAVLLDQTLPDYDRERQDAREAGLGIGRKVLTAEVANKSDAVAALQRFVNEKAGALLVGSGPLFLDFREQLVIEVARHALPAIFVGDDYPKIGGLMSYGPSQTDAYRRGGSYVARILRGAKPAELPVDMATKFELVINLKTARSLGLTLPPTLLASADEVIE